jgi:hypothetical protein
MARPHATWCTSFAISPLSHLQNLNCLPPPSISHLHPAAHTNWKLCTLCVFMAPCRGSSSVTSAPAFQPAPKAEMWFLSPHSFAHNSQSLTSRVHPFLRSVTELWCDLSLFSIFCGALSKLVFFRVSSPEGCHSSSCPDPGASQSEEQPGTRPGEGNRLPLTLPVKLLTPLKQIPITPLKWSPLLWPPS